MAQQLPEHIGVIFDGNRRWAKAHGKEPFEGHAAGADRIFDFLSWCQEAGVETVTLYLLSLENFSRSPEELKALTHIIVDVVNTIAQQGNYKAIHVGSEEVLPAELHDAIVQAEKQTKNHTGLKVNLAIAYGGRQEIVDAVKRYLAGEENLQQAITHLDVEQISKNTYNKGETEPDLIIRTSGEKRLSGFMLWQSAYSEFYFCDVMWPDFSQKEFNDALKDFSGRKRRFGA
ncbi:MAG: polyprenyl diphosphate synthase [Micrococcaceae bacterium]